MKYFAKMRFMTHVKYLFVFFDLYFLELSQVSLLDVIFDDRLIEVPNFNAAKLFLH